MQLTVKTLKGSHFQIRVQPSDTVMAVKKNIEDVQGKGSYPCGQQLLIHNGKVLKDETTLADNDVKEDGFLVVMLSKSKTSGSSGTTSTQPAAATPPTSVPAANSTTPAVEVPAPAQTYSYDQVASNLVSRSNLEQNIQQIMDMGGGTWDRDTVIRALQAAYYNPERAVDYLYSDIPETAEVAVPVANFPAGQATETGAAPAAPASGAPNSSPLDMFPQETLSAAAGGGSGLGSLEFLRNNEQFQTLRSLVQENPQILQPMLQELGKQNPQMLRMIQEHRAEFLQLLNEPLEDSEGEMSDLGDQDMPHAINVTPAEQVIIERLERMGFTRASVIEAYLACDRNEIMAANYLLEHGEVREREQD